MCPTFAMASAIIEVSVILSLILMSLEMKYLKHCRHSRLIDAQDLTKYIPNYLKINGQNTQPLNHII